MKIGVKAYCDMDFIKHFESKADFLEVMAIKGKDYSFLRSYKIPIVIHAMHGQFGVNISDPKNEFLNVNSIKFAMDLANKTNSKKIIIHAGQLDSPDCSIEIVEKFIKKIRDKRIIVENLPDYRMGFKKNLLVNPKEMGSFLKKTNLGFCLDINHAISYAKAEGINYLEFLKKFILIKPSHFHLSGQKFSPYKEHLDFSDSDLDLHGIIKILPKDAEITLEVSRDIEKTEKDLELIRAIIKNRFS